MALILADRVRDTTTTTGTGTVALSGTAPTGYQNFSVIGNGNTTYYTINAGSQWEVGIGTYSSTGPTLSRDTVLESSNANALVDFAVGIKDVFVTYPSEKAVTTDGTETLTNKTINGSNNTITNVSLTTGVTGTLPVANGGTGVTTSTGTGSVVLNTSPTLVTPTLGAASATSIANALGAVGTPSYTFTGDTDTGMWSPAANTVAVSTGGSERLRIDSAGQLGIGTTSPFNRLAVLGPSEFSLGITARTSSTQTALLNHPVMALQNNSDAAGNGLNIRYQIADTGSTLRTAGGVGMVATAKDASSVTADMYFYTGISERMRITSAGNVGIGTTSPNVALEVNGNIHVSGADRSILNRSNSTLRFGTNNTEQIFMQGNGDIRFFQNTTTDPGIANTTVGAGLGANGRLALSRSGGTALFTNRNTNDGGVVSFQREGVVVGTISVTTTATSYNTSSDYRLKDIDGPIQNSGAYIDALKPVQGSWKADGSRFIGLLAHEVQEVSETQIATGEKDGEEMQAMDYSAPEIIANLIAEVQSLRDRVAQLEGN